MIFRLFFILSLLSANTFAAPNIVVSIQPLYGIVSALTQDITKPTLLLDTAESAHHFHLKPTQLSQLNSADLVVLVHPNFEEGLKKALQNFPAEKQILMNEQSGDSHSWLDIEKVVHFTHRLNKIFTTIDADNKKTYHANLQRLLHNLQQLKTNIAQQLKPHKDKKVASFSNAFTHFLNANHLNNSMTVSHYHGEKLSLFKVLNARKIIKKTQTQCLLATIDVPKKRIDTLAEGLSIKTARIDIIGNGDYFKLIQDIANKINQCLVSL